MFYVYRLPPNGPELSCGDVPLVVCSSLRGRSEMTFRICSASRGEIARRIFRQLERLVRTQTANILVNVLPDNVICYAAFSCSCLSFEQKKFLCLSE
jgi:hypothetical protein